MARLRYSLGAACLALLVAGCACAPAQDDRPQIIEIIAPAGVAQETLDSLNLGEPNYVQSNRNKRTIGVLREMFPELSKLIDQKVKDIADYLVRTAGPTVLSGLLGGGGLGSLFGGGGGGSEGGAAGTVSGSVNGGFVDTDDDSDTETLSSDNKSGSKISVSLPTFPPDVDNGDDDNSASVANKSSKIMAMTDDDNDVSINARIGDSDKKEQTDNRKDKSLKDSAIPDWIEPTNVPGSGSSNSNPGWIEPKNVPKSSKSKSKKPKEMPKSETSESNDIPEWEEPKRILDDTATSGANAEENNLQGAESQQQEVRVVFDDGLEGDSKARPVRKTDQEIGASDNNEALDDLTLEDADTNEENRDKRLVSFGFGGGSGASSGGSGGGSGNFLFDIVRLVAGSGGTEQTDESGAAAATADGEVGKGDGYTEGIPGPVTRLFIIANRGISNLIQDLILRIAQTSERLVNFKARLITSII